MQRTAERIGVEVVFVNLAPPTKQRAAAQVSWCVESLHGDGIYSGASLQKERGSDERHAARDGECGTRVVARLIGRQQDVSGLQLGRLPRALEGRCSPNFATLSSGKVEGIKGVQIGPGATQFTRIAAGPFPRSSSGWRPGSPRMPPTWHLACQR